MWLCFDMDEMSKFVASDLILGSLEKSHMLLPNWLIFQNGSDAFFVLFCSCHKIRFCSFGSVCYVRRVGVTSERLFQNGKYKSVTFSIKKKYPSFQAS